MSFGKEFKRCFAPPAHQAHYKMCGPPLLHPLIRFYDARYSTFEAFETRTYHNRKLGAMFLLLQLGCVFYVIYAVMWQQSYLLRASPVGTVRVTKTGTGLQTGLVLNGTGPAYCNEAARRAWNAAYPTQALSACRLWDATDVILASDMEPGLMVTTFADFSYQACGSLCVNFTGSGPAGAGASFSDVMVPPPLVSAESRLWSDLKDEKFYLAGVENMEIWIDHHMTTSHYQRGMGEVEASYYKTSSTAAAGVLKDPSGKILKTFPPYAQALDTIEVNPQLTKKSRAELLAADPRTLSSLEAVERYRIQKAARQVRLTVADLLQAAGASLDVPSDVPGIGDVYGPLSGPWGPYGFHSLFRKWGIALIVKINYINDYSFFAPAPIKYEISVERLEGVEYNFYSIFLPTRDFSARMKLKRSGIHVGFIQTGSIGKFDFIVLWVSLFATIGFFSLSQVVLWFVAMYLMPRGTREEWRRLYDDTKRPMPFGEMVQRMLTMRKRAPSKLGAQKLSAVAPGEAGDAGAGAPGPMDSQPQDHGMTVAEEEVEVGNANAFERLMPRADAATQLKRPSTQHSFTLPPHAEPQQLPAPPGGSQPEGGPGRGGRGGSNAGHAACDVAASGDAALLALRGEVESLRALVQQLLPAAAKAAPGRGPECIWGAIPAPMPASEEDGLGFAGNLKPVGSAKAAALALTEVAAAPDAALQSEENGSASPAAQLAPTRDSDAAQAVASSSRAPPGPASTPRAAAARAPSSRPTSAGAVTLMTVGQPAEQLPPAELSFMLVVGGKSGEKQYTLDL